MVVKYFRIHGVINSYKDLVVWQKSLDLSLQVYEATKSFPKEEIYGLISQIRRCAVSIPSNIAEGSTRQGGREYIRFLYLAFASGAELETQLLIASKLKYVKQADFDKLNSLLTEVQKMLNTLISKLKSST